MQLTSDEVLQKGVVAHKAGDLEEAMIYYKIVLDAHPEHSEANHNMGVLEVDTGHFGEAVPFLKSALQAGPNEGRYWVSYIDVLIRLGALEDALDMLTQAKGKGASGEAFDQLESRLQRVDVAKTTSIASEEISEAEKPSLNVQQKAITELKQLSKSHTINTLADDLEKVSVITPTFNRPGFLNLCARCFFSQTYRNIEWLILDDSEYENEIFNNLQTENISYQHSKTKLTIGEKRNRLISKSTGNIIINFDDDDYYSPTYIENVVSYMTENDGDFLNLRSFFLYAVSTKKFAYWDLMLKEGLHYQMSPDSITAFNFTPENNDLLNDNHLGYGGFSTFRKKVWIANPYQDINWGEDQAFANNAKEQFKLLGMMDKDGIVLHFIHPQNTSTSLPQYLIPIELMPKFFSVEIIKAYEMVEN